MSTYHFEEVKNKYGKVQEYQIETDRLILRRFIEEDIDMQYEILTDYCKEIGCYKMFLATNRSNISACKCYEKCGGKNTADDELVYSYNLK